MKYIIKLIFFGLLICLIYKINPTTLKNLTKLTEIPPQSLVVLSLFCVTYQIILGIELRILCSIFDVELSLLESIGLSSTRSIANYLPLGAGIISNALYLKKLKGLKYRSFISIVLTNTVLMIATSSAIGIIACVTSPYKNYNTQIIFTLFLILLSVLLILILMSIWCPASMHISNFSKNLTNKLQEGLSILNRNHRKLYAIISIKLITIALLSFKMKILFTSIDLDLTSLSIILLVTSTLSFQIITILPGNIGITESIAGIISASTGSDFQIGFIGFAIDRLIQFIWISFIATLSIGYFLIKHKTQ